VPMPATIADKKVEKTTKGAWQAPPLVV
jgi:hypothetical protein